MEPRPETRTPTPTVRLHEEVRNVARSLVNTVRLIRSSGLERPDAGLQEPRPK
jgi:hypothetical protein